MSKHKLPSGWRWVRLEQVAEHFSKTVPNPAASEYERFVSSEHIDQFDASVRRWAPSSTIVSSKKAFEAGDYLFVARSLYGSDFRERAPRVDFRGVCSNGILALRERPGAIANGFLTAILNHPRIWEFIVRNATGTLTRYVYWKTLKDYEFALPPIEEQRRIITLLESANREVEACEHLIRTTDTLRLSAREASVEKATHTQAKIGALCEMQNGRPFPSTEYCTEGIRLLRPANLSQDGSFNWRADRTVFMPTNYLTEANRFVVSRGDVVINLTAQSLEDGFMGRVCFATTDESCLLNQRIGRFVGFHDQLIPEYLFRVLQTRRFQAHAKAMCEGTKIKHMFWRHIEGFSFPLPPVDVQRHTCERLAIIDQACTEAVARKESAKRVAGQLVNLSLM